MIDYIQITNNLGEILKLELRNPEKSGFFIQGVDGLGPGKSTINMSSALGMDGSLFNSVRNESKNIVLDLGFFDDGTRNIETIRQQTYRFFPRKKLIYIEVKTDNRTGIISGYVESNEPNIFSKKESTIISITCPSAYFVSKDIVSTSFTGTTGGFTFPFSNESTTLKLLKIADIYINTTKNIFYDGEVDTGMDFIINILGNVNNLTINHVTAGTSMSIVSSVVLALTGSDLVSGDRIIISTNRGSKYIYLIRGGLYYNILNALGANSSWFVLARGDNVFSYTATSGVANLLFGVNHRLVFEGI
jgi:hypothetical protein